MADFLDKLSVVLETRADLRDHLRTDASPGEAYLEQLVRDHWAPLPEAESEASWSAYAIDGSVRQANLDNGSYLFVAQALCIGDDGFNESSLDVEVLPSTTQRDEANRFVDLFQRRRELFLACEVASSVRVPEGSVLFLDGALYGLLPQLYTGSEVVEQLRQHVLHDYLELLATAARRRIQIVAVSKTSREATHCRLWRRALGLAPDEKIDLSDSELIHRWTDLQAGVSVPVILGSWGFTGGSRSLLEDPKIAKSPAIVSFFVRMAEFDDALRVDVPVTQVGRSQGIADLEGELLSDGLAAIRHVIDIMRVDYGGTEVYNALLYSVDREVRLKRAQFNEVYLPLIQDMTGLPVRTNRSERRFM